MCGCGINELGTHVSQKRALELLSYTYWQLWDTWLGNQIQILCKISKHFDYIFFLFLLGMGESLGIEKCWYLEHDSSRCVILNSRHLITLIFFSSLNIYLFIICVDVCTCVHAILYSRGPENTLKELVFSFYSVGSRDWLRSSGWVAYLFTLRIISEPYHF